MNKLELELTPIGSTKLSMKVISQSPSIQRGSNVLFDLGDVCLLSLAGPEINTAMRKNSILVWVQGIDSRLDSEVVEIDMMTQLKRDNAISRINDCVRLFNEQE